MTNGPSPEVDVLSCHVAHVVLVISAYTYQFALLHPESPMDVSLPRLSVFLVVFSILSYSASACHPDDLAALLAFKSGILADPSGILRSWTPSTDCCTWSGISCFFTDAKNISRVTSLSLAGQTDVPTSYLSGSISPSLAKLRYLDGLYLQNLRNISGPFPASLFSLPNLLFVYIENNRLSGRLPQTIGKLSQLQAFSLQDNRFTGSIPSSVSNLTQLTQLKLGGNFLTGTIPYGVRALTKLTYLTFERNGLSGAIPNFFDSFSDLRILRLSHNIFSGQIPTTISSLAPKLQYLELGHNALTGTIPKFLSNFKTLDTLDLSSNLLTGIIPKSFSNLTKIFNLDLSRNALVDPFPKMKVKGIESLDLSYNNLHLGKIPDWVTSSPIIYSLKLAKCGISQNLDNWKPKETYFYDYIDLSDNAITGSPVQVLNRTDYLVGFWAGGNKLKFRLESLRIATTMKYLDLSKNQVYGKVPKAVAGLEKLNVSYNQLCGEIPATKFPASSFVGNRCLCGPPLKPCKT